MYETIRYEVVDPVATITLNRPDRLNAITGAMLRELQEALAAAEADASVVGIVLTGEGRGFCAGADMSRLQSQTGAESPAPMDLTTERPGAIEEMGPDFKLGLLYFMAIRKPIICAVNGPCAGLGFVIAMLCDMRFASEEAKFTTAFANRGLIAEHGISWLLPRLIGSARALDLLWSGRLVKADEAERIGLVNRVVMPDALVTEATDYVKMLAAHSAPLAMQVIKQQVYTHLSASLGQATEESIARMAHSLGQPDFKEGVMSFVEKRPPNFARVATP